jgi:hypothetical protein
VIDICAATTPVTEPTGEVWAHLCEEPYLHDGQHRCDCGHVWANGSDDEDSRSLS